MDLLPIKVSAEACGALLTLLSVALMGRTGRTQRWGVGVAIVSVIPWSVFAIVTSSWLMLAQSLLLGSFSVVNLVHLLRKGRHAA